jgi:hypothetical protein
MLKSEHGEDWDSLSEEEKQQLIEQRKNAVTLENLAKFLNPSVLVELIQAHPEAFSLMDRYNIDYAEQLINKGVINFTNTWGEQSKKAFKTLINALFANSGLTTFNSQQIELLL